MRKSFVALALLVGAVAFLTNLAVAQERDEAEAALRPQGGQRN